MIETPRITETTEQAAAVIHLRIPRKEMQQVFGPAVEELMEVLAAQDVTPAGPVFAHHLRMDPEVFDFELGVPVEAPVSGEGRVKPGSLPAARVARTVYHGPYEGLPEAWGEFDAWIVDSGHTRASHVWESYVEGPHSSSDPTEWRTELTRPLGAGEQAASPGHFCWHDLSTPDPEAAIAFYGHVLGWSAVPFEGEGAPTYWTWATDGGHGAASQPGPGGLMELTDELRERGARPGWTGYVWTEDTDRDTERVVELGGSVLIAPDSIPSVGRMAFVRDAQGAAFMLMTPEPPEAPEASEPVEGGDVLEPGGTGGTGGTGIGRFSWNELATTDLDSAFDFYSRLLGWEETGDFDMGEMGAYRIFGSGGVDLGGMFSIPPWESGPPSWLYYVRVEDLDAALDRVREAGGEVTHGPSDIPGGRTAHCLDPEGTHFALHEETEAPATESPAPGS